MGLMVTDIKFQDGGKLYTFSTNGLDLKINDAVIVETSKGKEIGYVASSVRYEEDENNSYLNILSIATQEDLKTKMNLLSQRSKVLTLAKSLIEKYKLNMKLVDADFTLDNSKVIISYVSEDRVDFRELVKDLAIQLKQRIEMKQIGVRDQAKTIGAIGSCGKECCCKKYLNDFDKVSIKMAKTQNLSLNPTKISGVCGRLMCCLAFENDFYAEVSNKMPKVNSLVHTPDGDGIVVYNNLLKSIVSIKIQNDTDIKINEYPLEQISFTNNAINNAKQNTNFHKNCHDENKKPDNKNLHQNNQKNNINTDVHNENDTSNQNTQKDDNKVKNDNNQSLTKNNYFKKKKKNKK